MPTCPGCNSFFTSSRGLSTHCNHNQSCRDAFTNQLINHGMQSIKNNAAVESINMADYCKKSASFDFDDFDNFDDNTQEEADSVQRIFHDKEDCSLITQYQKYCSKGKDKIPMSLSRYKSAIDLLEILHKAGSPLYLFDHVMKWAQKSTNSNHFDFKKIPMRDKFIENLMEQFDYNLLKPITKKITLPGSNATIEIILHDFMASLYTLLCDEELMHISNLLLDENDIFKAPEQPTSNSQIDDINTGEVWHLAYNKYVKIKDLDILCPIIFFIDKTHTDTNGRLCIEQVRFTLGIFKRSVRNQSRAWRSIGYIMDQAHIVNNTRDPTAKMQDYQYMLENILESYKRAQTMSIAWEIKNFRGKLKKVSFWIPTLFIIGDTDGHDKLVGKFAIRNSNVKRLCRYCDCPFDSTDDPSYVYKLNKADIIANKIKDGKVEELKDMSMHCVRNAWADVHFCDVQRGIFGATPAEAMHCLQQGLYQYILGQLFLQKKILKKRKSKVLGKSTEKNQKSSEDVYDEIEDEIVDENEDSLESEDLNWNDSVELSTHGVFTISYANHINKLAKQIGYMLMHQSDRNLPRTHFSTNYTSVSQKTANEMSGIFIVFLMVLSTSEGKELDINLGNERAAQYIRVFEVMLMLEHFCKNEVHLRKDIKLFQRVMKPIMSYIKDTINRTVGNKMKIIKFHLPQHFAEDMIRFGSMANFDSGIGEMHHKTFAKKPANNTQRRKDVFEKQAATRQIENMAIERAIHNIYPERLQEETENSDSITKGYSIEFCLAERDLVYRKLKNRPKCKWNDENFQKKLATLCSKIVDSNAIMTSIKFFTQHNRQGNIFRADPCFDKTTGEPWYDWVYINWGDNENNCVPAKILIFMNIEEIQFLKTFPFGGSYVNEAGAYAIIYSFLSNETILAHLDSKLVVYGNLIHDDDAENLTMYAVSVDSIVKPCIAIPYRTDSTIINATEWLILKSKDQWYSTFLEFMHDQENQEKLKKQKVKKIK